MGPGGPGKGPINLSLGPVDKFKADPPRRNAQDRQSDIHISGAQLGSDWERDLMAYWIAHRYYPPAAGERGESGLVRLHLKVDRTGRVTALNIISGSGSAMIDAAALGTWRGARLSPFPTNTPEASADIDIDINYILYR
jgi:TonB family protein